MTVGEGPRLGIDVQRLLGARTGVARYLGSLLDEWARGAPPFSSVTLYAPRPIGEDLLPKDHGFVLRDGRGGAPHPAVWTHWTLARMASREVDVLFCPAYVAPLTYRGRLVVTIHDVLQEILRGSFPGRMQWVRGLLYRTSARRSDRVLTDSESSKADIERLYGVPANRVSAIPLGADTFQGRVADESDVRERYDLGDEPIVLFVGKFSRRRNLPELVEAFARVRAAGIPGTLVLAGPNHLDLPIAELGDELGLGRSLRLPGFVPDDDLRSLYELADVFVYPSDYEGFGLPVIEAMAAGTAVVTLANSSLREVAGDDALLVESASVERLADAIRTLLTDDALRAAYAARGRTRAARFSWSETARQTLEVLAAAAQ